MNDNIKELAKQAGFKIFGEQIVAADGGSSGAATICLGRFAELIIAECARISEESDSTMTGQGAASAQEFREHFGVK